MTVEEVRRRARDFHESSLQKALLGMVLGSCLAVFFAWSAAKAAAGALQLGWGLLSCWGLFTAVQSYRWLWPGSAGDSTVAEVSVAFYRRELERRRDYEMHVWRRTGLPVAFLGIAAILGPPLMNGLTWNAAPFFVLLAVWGVAFVFQRRQDRRRLRREIEELDWFEK